MKLTKKLAALLIAASASLLGLSACSDDTNTTNPTTTAGGEGFADDAVIGVSLPWLGTQNWAEADKMFMLELTAAGFTPMVQHAENRAENQLNQIEAMIEAGAKVIVVGAVDGSTLGTVLEKAKEQGIYIIGYDRLLENTDAIDALVQFGSVDTGRAQGQALLDGLAAWGGEAPWNIELFGGSPADPNAPNFFTGAMEVLQPKIDDGTLVVVSGQTTFQDCATPDWSNERAQSRMDSLLATHYSDIKIDGALSPNDGIARAIITSVENAGYTDPFPTSGLDAENETVTWISEGKQYSTVDKPTTQLVDETIRLIKILQSGEALPKGTETAENGVKTVEVFALTPAVVTRDNACEIWKDDEGRLALMECA